MLISRKVDYAIRCLVYMARLGDREVITTSDLSRQVRVSKIFLAKIFQLLAKKRIVESGKGKGGGIRLIKRQVSLGEVLLTLEPNFALNKCLRSNHRCFLKGNCPMHKLLIELNRDLMLKLNKISIKQLAEKGGDLR